jgi:hypothetical protein
VDLYLYLRVKAGLWGRRAAQTVWLTHSKVTFLKKHFAIDRGIRLPVEMWRDLSRQGYSFHE